MDKALRKSKVDSRRIDMSPRHTGSHTGERELQGVVPVPVVSSRMRAVLKRTAKAVQTRRHIVMYIWCHRGGGSALEWKSCDKSA